MGKLVLSFGFLVLFLSYFLQIVLILSELSSEFVASDTDVSIYLLFGKHVTFVPEKAFMGTYLDG